MRQWWYNTESGEMRYASTRPAGYGWIIRSEEHHAGPTVFSEETIGTAITLGLEVVTDLLSSSDGSGGGFDAGGGDFGGGGASGDW